ncbi:hypothetical protein HOH45_02290 [bacterium]|jgi:hypothetical protein|nr:hypothetical protein [bacterium]
MTILYPLLNRSEKQFTRSLYVVLIWTIVLITLPLAAPSSKESVTIPSGPTHVDKLDPELKSDDPDFHFKRNPFEPVKWRPQFKSKLSLPTTIKLPESKTLFSLTGIIWDDKKPYAILSFSGARKIVSEGDIVEGKTIHSISRSKLILKSAKETFILMIGTDILL